MFRASPERSFLRPLVEHPQRHSVLVNTRTGIPLATHLEPALDSASRRRGLLGRDGLDRGHAIVIAPTNAIHMWFMRFAIDVVFAASDGVVVAVRHSLRPWRVAIAPRAFCAIEMAAGTLEPDSIRLGDRLEVSR